MYEYSNSAVPREVATVTELELSLPASVSEQ